MKNRLHENQLLHFLDANCHRQLAMHGDWVELYQGQALTNPNLESMYLYFPVCGVVALIMQKPPEKPLALTFIGKEGMIGIAPVLGVYFEPYTATVVSTCFAFRISAIYLLKLKSQHHILSQLLDCYVAVMNAQFAQATVCNGMHNLQQRLAKLLLSYSDRMCTFDFIMTQALSACLLGVRRSGVNKTATKLQQAKIVRYSRGQLSILKPAVLAKMACNCYRSDKDVYKSIIDSCIP